MDLQTHVDTHGPFDWRSAVTIVSDIASQLQELHADGFFHGRLNSYSVELEPSEDGIVSRLVPLSSPVPFELRIATPDEARTAVGYISPESLRDPQSADKRTDIYIMGCILFFALTGNTPFGGESLSETLFKHRTVPATEPTQGLTRIPPEVITIINRAMEKNPNDRFQSAADMSHALRASLSAQGQG